MYIYMYIYLCMKLFSWVTTMLINCGSLFLLPIFRIHCKILQGLTTLIFHKKLLFLKLKGKSV